MMSTRRLTLVWMMGLWLVFACGCSATQQEAESSDDVLADFAAMAVRNVPQAEPTEVPVVEPKPPAARTLSPQELKELEAPGTAPPVKIAEAPEAPKPSVPPETGPVAPPALSTPPLTGGPPAREEPGVVFPHEYGPLVRVGDKFKWFYRLRYRGGWDVDVKLNTKTGAIQSVQSTSATKQVQDIINQLEGHLDKKNGESVEPYPELNSLLITISVDNISKIKELSDVLGILDVPRKQVWIEAKVVEVTGDQETQWGISHLLKRLGRSTFQIETSHHGDDYDSAAGVIPPYTGSIIKWSNLVTDKQWSVDAIVDMLARESKLNVISSPSMVVEEGSTAQLLSGEKVPLVTIYTESGRERASTQLTDVGIKLYVTPLSVSEDSVRMHIITEVSQWRITTQTDPPNPVVGIKSARTKVEVRDGGTLVIGGLTSERTLESYTKVPVLGDIPLIKYLFRSSRKVKEKVEVVIFVTPTITAGPLTGPGV